MTFYTSTPKFNTCSSRLAVAARMLLSALIFSMVLSTASDAREITVNDAQTLATTLAGAKGGETILLKPGNYGRLALTRGGGNRQFNPNVTLTSADPTQPAVLSGLDLRETAGLTFDRLIFDYESVKGAPTYAKPFKILHSDRITIRNSLFDGDMAWGVSAEADGYATGFGLNIGGGHDIQIENNEIRNFYRGLVTGGIDGLVIRGNNLHSLRMDGMNFSGVRNVLIEGNFIHDFRRSPKAGDHADMIQFWTRGSPIQTVNITIRGNVLLAGNGGSTQSIFMRNEEVDQKRAGRELFYRNIRIEENLIVNGHLHGITVGETDGLVIRANTILRVPTAAKGQDLDRRVRIPRINVAEASTDVTIHDNVVAAVPQGHRTGWTVQGNLVAQDRTVMMAGHYHKLFSSAQSGDPGDPGSFIVRPGSAADRPGLGASLTHAGADLRRFRTMMGADRR